jgi:hypothetical protein
MVSQQSFSPQQEPVQSYRLRDTSRFSVRQETVLPLNGVTLDLQLRDTFEFDFQGINRDIEEVLLRLSISNGFPVGGFLEVYFCRQNGVNPQAPLVYVDSLYDSSTAQVMDAPEVNSSGEATEQTNQITDVVMGGMDWEKLRDLNCNRIVILARLTTSGNALEEVRILEDDKLSIRLGARIKLRKTF